MKIVLANGCFDLFHYGHLLHLEAARKMGDRLIVSITDDAHVNKQGGRPIFNQHQRSEMVAGIWCVYGTIIVAGLLDALKKIKPDVVVKGCDYDYLEPEHEAYCKTHGIKIRFTRTKKFSTTEMINEIRRRS